jgi:hypothetical protein
MGSGDRQEHPWSLQQLTRSWQGEKGLDLLGESLPPLSLAGGSPGLLMPQSRMGTPCSVQQSLT